MYMGSIARRSIVLLASALAAAGLVVGAGQAAAAPPSPGSEYVNLGDSYSAGSGVNPVVPGTYPLCGQSENNAAHVLARSAGLRLTDISCGGAKTSDFFAPQFPGLRPQLSALSPRTKLVTLMIGGNDENVFGQTVAQCVAAGATTGFTGHPCQDRYGNSIADTVNSQTYPNLVNAYRAVRAHAPNATVAVINYPTILPNKVQGCPGFPVAPGDVPYTYSLQKTLNDAIARAAKTVGFTVVDAASASVGHDSCQPVGTRWVEPLITDQQLVPVHPNALGERQMAMLAGKALGLK
ncbi:SGNH/GDSL hydrolase family protein [Jongsikchunia kroppenstedtii]|uniref:SGNH/GDSL hydrolase family protein n=1 Tax=Jongsikchunia kroppenstedtii TaxID=1121721 RepID=UPI000476D893